MQISPREKLFVEIYMNHLLVTTDQPKNKLAF